MFTQIKELVALKQVERQKFLDTVRDTLLKEAKKYSIAIEVDSRAKHFYSIYQKMRKRNKRPEEIFDLFGIRILCDSIEACYTALGLVHKLWKPLEGRFKDYIAMPKANGYQSLHTTVITGLDSFASPIEVQIRTFDMHNVAEHGIASHWLYKKGTTNEVVHETYLPVVNKLKNFLQESSTSFLAEMKKEILQDSIFVFTPNGKVIELPAGATAIDFAYAIHSDIGDHCSLAKADGKIISLSCSLQNTQVIEIVASVAAHPHINWLNNVKTAKARNKIKQWLSLNDDAVIAENNLIAKKKKLPQEVTEHTETEVKITQNKTDTNVQVRVQNQKNMLVRFAKCCNPVLGDDIIGFVSRGRGIIIHCKSCKSIKHIKEFDERKIDTEWE
jgi:GTP pyrophosphokinase